MSAESPCHTSSTTHPAEMANEHPDAPKQSAFHFSSEVTKANKQLLARIGSESISRAPSIKGSIYFYSGIPGDDSPGKEELINDPSALNSAIETLGIEIRYENKHHRWDAQLLHALKILEFAAMHLRQHSNASPGSIGVNAELKWQDEKDLENIIHLTQSMDNCDWQVSRYA